MRGCGREIFGIFPPKSFKFPLRGNTMEKIFLRPKIDVRKEILYVHTFRHRYFASICSTGHIYPSSNFVNFDIPEGLITVLECS